MSSLVPSEAARLRRFSGRTFVTGRMRAAIRLIACLLAMAVAPLAQSLAQNVPLPSVTAAPAQKRAIAPTVERVGQTRAVEDVALRARVEGVLAKRLFKEGAHVARGDLLFVIERAPFEAEVQRAEAALARAEATLENAELSLKRAEELRKRATVSQQRLDDALAAKHVAQADVKAREAELRLANINLDYTEIRAPVGGRIGRARYSVGNLVGPDSDVLATLVKLDPIHVYWSVSEQVLLAVRRDLREREARGEAPQVVVPRIRLRDGSFYDSEGQIDFRDNRVGPTTGTQSVRAVFANPDKLLLPGQYVSIVLQIGAVEDRLVIPQASVQEDQGGRFVLVVNEQQEVTVRRVTLGVREGIYWVVESGLAEGEQVVWQGLQKVRPGTKVKALVATPDPTATE